MVNVLITAGGTVERIDSVRAITNYSTGRLGASIAEEFLKGKNVNITYICAKNAVRPSNDAVEQIEIESVQDLLQAIQTQLASRHYDIVIHSMAVSDYYLAGTASEDDILSNMENSLLEKKDSERVGIKKGLDQAFEKKSDRSKKMSSSIDTMYFQLKQTPKVIARIKQLQPNTVLVGFKLLVDVPEEELMTVGKKLMEKNACDFVLANDMGRISDQNHVGYLIDTQGHYNKYQTKQEIARGIVTKTMKGRGNR